MSIPFSDYPLHFGKPLANGPCLVWGGHFMLFFVLRLQARMRLAQVLKALR